MPSINQNPHKQYNNFLNISHNSAGKNFNNSPSDNTWNNFNNFGEQPTFEQKFTRTNNFQNYQKKNNFKKDLTFNQDYINDMANKNNSYRRNSNEENINYNHQVENFGNEDFTPNNSSKTQFHKNLYKTEICQSFQETHTCRYGNKCQFAHGYEELRSVNRHPKYKTEICKSFTTLGSCPFGRRCRFAHHEDELRQKTHSRSNSKEEEEIENGEILQSDSHSLQSDIPSTAVPGLTYNSGGSNVSKIYNRYVNSVNQKSNSNLNLESKLEAEQRWLKEANATIEASKEVQIALAKEDEEIELFSSPEKKLSLPESSTSLAGRKRRLSVFSNLGNFATTAQLHSML